MIKIDKILVHVQAARSSTATQFRQAFPDAGFTVVANEAQLRSISHTLDRHTIYIGPRSGSYVSRFRPPSGMLCASFWKFTSETFCPMGCHYCYLSLTLRIIPYVRVASNLDRGLAQMERVLQREAQQGHRAMFNIGELADGRILDPITNLSRHLLPVLDCYPNGMLHVLTKAGVDTIDNYLDLAHLARGRIIHVASVNPQIIIDLTEEETPPVAERLTALGKLQQAGYRVRLRIDPIFDLRDLGYSERAAFNAYDELVDQIGEFCHPEMVTLGSYRPNPQLLPRIRQHYPDSPVLRVVTRKDGVKRRMAGRGVFYRRIAERLRAIFPDIRVALCKEPLSTWKEAGLDPKLLECSCLPFVNERCTDSPLSGMSDVVSSLAPTVGVTVRISRYGRGSD